MGAPNFFRSLVSRARSAFSSARAGGDESHNLTKRQVLRLSTARRFPTWRQWQQLPRVLTGTETRLIRAASFAILLSGLFMGGWWLFSHRVEMPAAGGEYTEALVGSPQFVNPLYASQSDVDRDLTRLVYSGLFVWDPVNGVVPDLADTYTISEDHLTYTIHIRDGARWHHGEPVRASDVVFTVQSIQNPAYHSPLSASFRGVAVSEVDERTVQFTLQEPFPPFLTALTVGILPAEFWQDIAPQNARLASYNLEPIGSGPYKFDKYVVDKKGNIRSYTLTRNTDFYGPIPLIDKLTFKFYADAEAAVAALENRNVEGVSFVPSTLTGEIEKNNSVRLVRPSMLWTTVLFFNEEAQPILEDINIRKAIAHSLNKPAIVSEALGGFGNVIEAPILPGNVGHHPDVATYPTDIAQALALLDETDYTVDPTTGLRGELVTQEQEDGTEIEVFEPLTLTLTTIDQPEFLRTAETIATQATRAGITIVIQPVTAEQLIEEVIKPRAYDMLLTGVQLGLDPDPYPFWHSSQAKDPGLNLALYANRKADALLEEARTTTDPVVREEKYRAFQDILAEDLPAIFLYQSNYAYAISTKVQNAHIDRIYVPSDRFFSISEWYVKTRKVVQ